MENKMPLKTKAPLSGQPIVLQPMIEPGAPPRHERSDAAENRRRILAEAERLFGELGVENVAMQDIARAAEVGQGTLYRRFASKSELCMALLDVQMSEFQDHVLTSLRDLTMRGASKRSQLVWFLDALVHFSERHAPMLCAALHELHGTNEQPAISPNSMPFLWQRMTAIGLLQTGVARREFRKDLDVQVVADMLLGMLHPAAFQSLRHSASAYTLERISAGLTQIVDGLAS
jgi:AcrR family transcriptional regulator